MVVRGLFPLPSCLFARGYILSLLVFLSGDYILFPLSSISSILVRGLSPITCSIVDYLAAWSKSFLVASFVINSGILLTGVLTFWGEFIILCSNLGVFLSVILCVVFNGLLIVDWLCYAFSGS